MTDAAPRALAFAPGAVRLGGGSVFTRARDEMLHLARVYPVDRLLAVFRAAAGLDTRGAAAPGAWEDFGHPSEQSWSGTDYPGRENAQTANLLRGHYAGHFLSMLALAAAGEDDPHLRAKVDEMVAGLAEVQSALAATGRYSHPGFLAAYGEWQFARLEDFAPYGEIWAPYYTCHKIMAGLLDAHELTGSAQALEVVTAMGHWVSDRLGRLDDAHRQKMWSLYIAGEFGGMNETLARLSVVASEPRFLDTARMFDQHELIEAGAAGRDILDGMHANQHLPQLIGYVREYELTGERRYLDAAVGIFDQVVPGRVYAHGGTGESELWGPAGCVAGDIGRRNAETCASYNLVKLARALFAHTLEPRFLDYAERALHNHILGSRRDARSDTSPEVTYMFPVHPGALPEFDNIGTCCGGTGLENHVTHQGGVFVRGAGAAAELWVALYTPATLEWSERGLRVELDTAQPFGPDVRLTVHTADAAPTRLALHLRIPTWVAGAATVAAPGEPPMTDAAPGAIVTIDRDWHSGDAVTLHLPAALRADPVLDAPDLHSVSFGPSVLVARDPGTTTLERPLARLRLPGGAILAGEAGEDPGHELCTTGAVEIAGLRYEPIWTGSDERYHLYVRAADPTIGFAGIDTEVPVRTRVDGRTILDELWARPEPADAPALVSRLVEVCRAGVADGLVTGSEARRILAAALRLVDDPAARAFIEDSALRPDEPVPPSVAIVVTPPPAASGWHTAVPTIALTVTADVRIEVRIDEGEWREYRHPFALEREGIVTVQARLGSRDGSGREVGARRVLSIDTAPPASTATTRSLGSSVEITLTAADDVSGVESIRWETEGTFWATFQEAFVRALTDREQVIEYAAVDRAGNEEPRRRLVLPAAPSSATIAIAPISANELARSENDS